MPAIPASATVTNKLAEPLAIAGLQTFAVAEVRTIDLSAFGAAQQTVIWNALYNAVLKNLITAPAVTFSVEDSATGHQGVVNSGGQGFGGSIVPVSGGFGLPATATITNLVADPLVVAGIRLEPGASAVVDLTTPPINQLSKLWNALIRARDKGLISSADLTTEVTDGFTGQQDTENSGGHGPGGQVAALLQTAVPSITINGVVTTVRGQAITVQGQ